MKTLILTYSFIFCFSLLFSCHVKNNKITDQAISELDTISFDSLSKKAYQYLFRQQDSCEAIYKIGGYEHWDYNQQTGKLIFSDSGVKKLIIDYEDVGSVSVKSNTWLWAWGNTSIEERVKSKIGMVRDFGKKRGFNKLINSEWTADEYDGWEMTAIASYLMKAKGAYRVPLNDSTLYAFFIFKNITWADSTINNK